MRRHRQQCTRPTQAGELARRTRYAQREHGGGINGWIYEYENGHELTKRWAGCGLEFGVQLEGEWSHEGPFTGRRTYGAKEIHRASMGEPYRLRYRSPGRRSLQVGFIVCAHALERMAGPDAELRFLGADGAKDPTLVDFAWHYVDARARRAHIDADVHSAVRDYVARHATPVPLTPLLRAKRELERTFDCDLPLGDIAAIAGLHRDTFARRFQEAFGTGPASYRVLLRLNYASRLCWSRPTLTIAGIAEESGFRSLPYFHRLFVRAFGMTPARVRARFLP